VSARCNSFVLRQAACRASLLVASARFRSDDFEDLKQDMVLDVIRRSPKFDAARGDWEGFVRGVMRNRAAVLVIRERRRAKEIPVGDFMNRGDASDTDSLEILHKRPSSGAVDALHLSIDVRRILSSLPPHLQSLAVLLGQMPVQDVCRHVGKSRSRVYQMTCQLRNAFVHAGLRPGYPRKSAVGR
jgi:RNA polymerase sigma-70 factor, ECF subfamily